MKNNKWEFELDEAKRGGKFNIKLSKNKELVSSSAKIEMLVSIFYKRIIDCMRANYNEEPSKIVLAVPYFFGKD